MKKILFIPVIWFSVDTFSQCSGGNPGGTIVPTTSWQTVTVTAGNYYSFTVPAGSCDTYDFSFCQGGGSASYDTQLSLRTNADVYAGGYNDDNCSLQSQIMGFAPGASGTYRVLVNNYFCSASGSTATLAYKKNAPGSNVNYQYLNNAASNGNCITLTTAANNQTGCAWDVNSTLNFASDFSYDFTVNLGNSDAGADGMAFVLQNDPLGRCKCGTAGGSLGAGGISNSLTVEIDTYLNTEDRDDGMTGVLCSGGPEPDHLDIWLNGVINPEYGASCVTDAGERVVPNAVRLMNGANIYNIENGLNHILRISWSVATNTLTAAVLNSGLTTTYGTISYSFNPMTVFGTNTPFFGFTASTGGLSNEQTYCLPNVLLPVEIGSFTGFCQGNKIEINWTSLTEHNNAFYLLERSENGVNYETLAIITGETNSGQLKNYGVTDEAVSSGKSYYYRLSQTDLDGESHFIGHPLQLKCNSDVNGYSIYPNPADDAVNIIFDSPLSGEHEVSVYDITGKFVKNYLLTEKTGYFVMPVYDLSEGVYFVILKDRTEVILNEKIVITR